MEDKIEKIIQKNYELDYFIGNVLVAKNNQIIFNKSDGMGDYEKQIPHTSSSRFFIGSVSKQFVAVAIMKLQEEGKLLVTDTIDKFLEDYNYASRITIHQLLTHSSGIINYTETPDYYLNREKEHTPQEIIDYFKDKELMFEPGSSFYYSNSGYVLLAQIIESVSALPFDVYMAENIFYPHNMNHTGVLKKGTNIDSPMIGYTGTMEGYKAGPAWNISIFYGAGNLYSTIEDLYKWNRALYSDLILSSHSREELFKKHIGNSGYGWFVNQDHVYHDGRITGFNSLIKRKLDEKLVIIILSNRTYYGSRIVNMCDDISSILNGREIVLPKKVECLDVVNADLTKYVGEYFEPNMKVSFFAEVINKKLCFYVELNPTYKFEVSPIKQSTSEDTFSLGMSPGVVTYKKDSEGNVTTATLAEDGFLVSLDKIE
ncbi:serine hydrolase domain-containing protein [Gracilibacillus massiliensis]|uniref:serine hydrolase domain-containing protein n=1 Tax=Gracilibacillus massiliensis TaxID=1564956 RepID=UPI00071E1E87|nr:serine hydrolase domain-containing protein [Gracilibacillus massiliensis]